MTVVLILAHPRPDSFNHAIAARTRETLQSQGHEVIFHDLYAERFDPVLPAGEIPENGAVAPAVARYGQELQKADGLVLVHPNWWGQPPAILKGWVDRVLRPGVAYRFLPGDGGEGVPEGLLPFAQAMVFNTSDTPEEREREVMGDPLERIWGDCILKFCGVRRVTRRMFSVVVTASPEKRSAWLEEVERMVAKAFSGSSA